ncbi:hypothetical protein AXG93_3309s1500 [Marchantia polymorpha subsp. ruderalis]|uniref:Uncharacterized protein n=1 Tax=Marchantia polymorpha subsp. ruderalis TaxID=1480154 RepID=A0A176W5P5_MARPO|nr:hypothetical protein AXG93_3309s1500 [Marchantia polymorpha subsp. ruderalis]
MGLTELRQSKKIASTTPRNRDVRRGGDRDIDGHVAGDPISSSPADEYVCLNSEEYISHIVTVSVVESYLDSYVQLSSHANLDLSSLDADVLEEYGVTDDRWPFFCVSASQHSQRHEGMRNHFDNFDNSTDIVLNLKTLLIPLNPTQCRAEGEGSSSCCGGSDSKSGGGGGGCSSHKSDPALAKVGKEFEALVASKTMQEFEEGYETGQMEGTISRDVVQDVINIFPEALAAKTEERFIDVDELLAEALAISNGQLIFDSEYEDMMV